MDRLRVETEQAKEQYEDRKEIVVATNSQVDSLQRKLADSITCTICKEIYTNATCAIPCLHTFCEECIKARMKQCTACPTCRKQIVNTQRNFIIDSSVEAFKLESMKASAQ